MHQKRLKGKIEAMETVSGCIIPFPSPHLVEVCGLLGFDFVFIDMEHAPVESRECEEMIRAADARGMDCLVRLSRNTEENILKALDIGASGVIVPDIRDGSEVLRAVKSAKYHPSGCRGLAATRSSDFGLSEPLGQFVKKANEQTMVFGLIESVAGLKNTEEILSVDGVDGAFIGTNDLSQSLGVPGQTSHPLVREAVEKIFNLGMKLQKPVGLPVRSGEDPEVYIRQGARILLTGAVGLFAEAAREFLRQVP